MASESVELSETEKSIFEVISKGQASELISILSQYKGDVNLYDENGMTPLQHAAYKGSKDMVQALLDRGANVNFGQHGYHYTALHFGALSGNSDVCRLLLAAGAHPSATNSVGRTAAQMAAFVGNHHTVATINNFIPRSTIAYFSILQGPQTEPCIPPYIVDSMHKFLMEVNIHPVRVALNLQRYPGLLEHIDKVRCLLEILRRREMNRGNETNEIMAFKYHYLYYIVNEIYKIRDRQVAAKDTKRDDASEEKKHDIVELFAKRLLKVGKDGVSLDFMDAFLKDCVREFPFKECTIFQQMLPTLASKDSPFALSVINASINGQRGFVDAIAICNTCGEEKPAKKCSKCKSVQYCDRECQRLHWFVHKKACNRVANAPQPAVRARPNVDAAELSAQLQNLIAG